MPFHLHIIQSCYDIMKIHSAVSCNMYTHVMNCVLRLISITSILIGHVLTLKVLVATIDAQREGMGNVGSARYEPALLPPCPTIRVLSYSN